MKLFRNKYLEIDDEQLMKFIQKGETAAFDTLYERYNQRLFAFLMRALNNNHQKAQDFLQDVFVKIIERPELFNPEKKFRTWIFSIAYNLCKNEYRRLKIRKNTDLLSTKETELESGADEYLQIEAAIDDEKFKNHIFSELATFEPEKQTIFLLKYQQNLSIKEISDICNCPEGTVKSRLFYMTKKLAEKFAAFSPVN
ncbi:sigma-70 family RNA polymerase sigma factor [candidate division KSB1 bacterium]|nr:sigma-70 family RNA polymerase sigma factor [candidate division KSB1 bacterium]